MPTPDEVEVLVPSAPDIVEVLVPSAPQIVEVILYATGGGGGGSGDVADNSITNAKLADMPANRIKGAVVAGDPVDLTGTQVTAMLNAFAGGPKGLVPLSTGGTTRFLRADGVFATPPGTGGGGGGDSYTPPSGIERTIESKLTEFVSFTDFYLDGDADYTSAWLRFGSWARSQSLAGKGVELVIPPGLYPFNHGASQAALCGIRRLRITGYGAVVVNTYDPAVSGVNFGAEMAFFNAINTAVWDAYRIDTVGFGANSVTLKTPGEHFHFTVGCSAMIASMDIQGYGYPPNLDRFEFVKVTAINTATGVFTIDPPLDNYHRDDFADWNPSSLQVGKARIYPLDSTVTFAPDPAFVTPFDVEHHYEGFEILPTPLGNYPYMSVGGKVRTFTNMRLPALSESLAQIVRGDSCTFIGMGEPDKLVDSIEYDSCTWDSSFTLQSSSINSISFRNCKAPYCSSGNAKSFYAAACDFDYWDSGALYGRGRSRVLVGCRIGSCGDQTPFPLSTYSALLRVYSPVATYANGVFTLPKATVDPVWNLTPGQACHWQAPGLGYSGDLGSFYVTRVYDDTTNIYVETTCPLTAVPSWALSMEVVVDGQPAVPVARVRPERQGTITFHDCYGGDNTRRITEATRAGERVGEYFKDTFAGSWRTDGYWYGRGGILKRVRVNVRQSTAIAGSKLEMAFPTHDSTTLVHPSSLLVIFIDLTVKGVRDFTMTALTGKVGADDVKLGTAYDHSGGVVITTLPTDRIVAGHQLDWYTRGINSSSYPPAANPPYLLPIAEVEMWFDGGMYLRPLVAYQGHVSDRVIGAVTGTMYP